MFIYLCLCMSICLCLCMLSVYVSVCLSVYPYVYCSLSLCVYNVSTLGILSLLVSVCLSNYPTSYVLSVYNVYWVVEDTAKFMSYPSILHNTTRVHCSQCIFQRIYITNRTEMFLLYALRKVNNCKCCRSFDTSLM